MSSGKTAHDEPEGAAGPWPTPPPGAPGAGGFPVVLSLVGARCLVVGGGRVGGRRARDLAACGASVTLVAPELDMSLDATSTSPGGGGTIERRLRPYRRGEASSYQFVVAATGVADVDRAVVLDALDAGVLVSSADASHPGNASLPAVHRDGAVTVAVSTAGTSPALAAWIRTRLASALGPGVGTLAELAAEARAVLRRTGAPTGSVDWDAAFDEAVPLVASGRVDEARALLLARCRAVPGGRDEPGGNVDHSVGSGS